MLVRDVAFTMAATIVVALLCLWGGKDPLPLLVLVELEYATRVARRGVYLKRSARPVAFRERRPLLPWGAAVLAYCGLGLGTLPGRWIWFVLPVGAAAIVSSKIWVSRTRLSPYLALAPASDGKLRDE